MELVGVTSSYVPLHFNWRYTHVVIALPVEVVAGFILILAITLQRAINKCKTPHLMQLENEFHLQLQ